jgi:hypothetical protein
MKRQYNIEVKVDQPEFIENLVERLACNHADMGYGSGKLTGEWQPIETSSNEVYVGGTIKMEMNREQLNIPYITNFLFTCFKNSDSFYRLEWASSMN